MATFSIYQDKENNSSILPNKLKDAGASQKRIVLKVLDKNSEDGNDVKLPVHVSRWFYLFILVHF